jgi:purine-nucleoside phosphorylase
LIESIRPTKEKRDPDIGPIAVMVSSEVDLNALRRRFSLPGKRIAKLMHSRLYFNGKEKGQGVSLVGPLIGAPYAVLILEKLVALGAHKILFVGWCGSIQPDIKIADIILANRAFSEEGTSKLYPIEGECFEPASGMVKAVKEALVAHGASFCEGGVWSTDAPYCETEEKVRKFRKKGVLVVEMELSALFAVGGLRNVEVGGLLLVSDERHMSEWRRGFSRPAFTQARRMAVEVIYTVCCQEGARSGQ